MNQNKPQAPSADYSTIKDLVLNVRRYLDEFRHHRKLCYAFLAVGLLYGFWFYWSNPKIYEAELSFMLNEDQNQAGGLSAVLSEFGGLLGSHGDEVNLQKILELGKSRNIAEKVFFDSCTVFGKSDFLANHLIKELETHGKWGAKSYYFIENPLKGFQFKHQQVESFTRLENAALKQLHALFLSMLTTAVSEKTSIMKLNVQCTDEMLAYELANRLFDKMSQFYINKTIEKQKQTYDDLASKTDSLRKLLHNKQYGLADLKDSYRATWLLKEEVPKTILDQDIKMLQLIYGEALKNKEIASYALDHKTPFIQAIDLPIMPLKVSRLILVKSLILGALYGMLLASTFIFVRKFYQESIQN